MFCCWNHANAIVLALLVMARSVERTEARIGSSDVESLRDAMDSAARQSQNLVHDMEALLMATQSELERERARFRELEAKYNRVLATITARGTDQETPVDEIASTNEVNEITAPSESHAQDEDTLHAIPLVDSSDVVHKNANIDDFPQTRKLNRIDLNIFHHENTTEPVAEPVASEAPSETPTAGETEPPTMLRDDFGISAEPTFGLTAVVAEEEASAGTENTPEANTPGDDEAQDVFCGIPCNQTGYPLSAVAVCQLRDGELLDGCTEAESFLDHKQRGGTCGFCGGGDA